MKLPLGKLFRFGVVGTTGFAIDFSLTWLLKEVVGINEYVANAIGFTFAATSNYFLNRRWTWGSENPNIKGEFLKFFGVSLAGLGINSLVIFLCQLFGDISFSVSGFTISSFWVAKIIATAVVMVWNFVVNNFFTFRGAPKK